MRSAESRDSQLRGKSSWTLSLGDACSTCYCNFHIRWKYEVKFQTANMLSFISSLSVAIYTLTSISHPNITRGRHIDVLILIPIPEHHGCFLPPHTMKGKNEGHMNPLPERQLYPASDPSAAQQMSQPTYIFIFSCQTNIIMMYRYTPWQSKAPNECSRMMPLAYRPVKTGRWFDFWYWCSDERWNWY